MRVPRPRSYRDAGSSAVAALVLVVLGLGAAHGGAEAKTTATGVPSASVANVWIDPDGGSCKRTRQAAAYADADACPTFEAAYKVAASGDVVAIRDGVYGSQGLSAGSKKLTFRAAGPGRPRFGQIVSAASNLVVRGIQIENRDNFDGPCTEPDNAILYPCGPNQTYDDVIVDGLGRNNVHGIRGVGTRFVLENSEVRNIVDQKGFEGGSDDMVIDHNSWHDIVVKTDGVHNECMYVDGGNRAVIRGNRFVGCPTMALFFTNWNGGPPYRDVLVEDNVFGHTLNDGQQWSGSCALVLGAGFNGQNTFVGWTIRYNTFEDCVGSYGSPSPDDTGTGRWYGNLGTVGECHEEWVYSYNVGETCGGIGDRAVKPALNDPAHPDQAPFYVDAPGGNFHLRPGSVPINDGAPGAYPARDADALNRLVGSAPDAGAYEFRGPTATTGVLAFGNLGTGSRPPLRLSTAMRSYAKLNPARVAVSLGNNDPTGGEAFPDSWARSFGWLTADGVKVAGVLGARDIEIRHGRYQFPILHMPAAYYARRFGGVQLIALDSTAVTAKQTQWLRRTLARRTNAFRVVAMHDPPFACGDSAADIALQKSWVPLFARYGVKLVLSGGAGGYERFEAGAVTYVVHGGGGTDRIAAPHSCPAGNAVRRAARATHGFIYFTVDSGGVLVRSVTLDGTTIDVFRIA